MDVKTLDSQYGLILVKAELGQASEIINDLSYLIKKQSKLFGEFHEATLKSIMLQADFFNMSGKNEESEFQLGNVNKILTKHHGELHSLTLESLNAYGVRLLENGKIEEAQEEYLTAAELGPPGSEIALFMAGQCYQALGNNKAALRCFKRSLHYDPMGISALEALGSLDTALFSKDGGLSLIEKWAGESLVSIKQNLGSHNPLRDVQTYQKRQFEQEA